MLFPVFARAREAARLSTCMSNVKELAIHRRVSKLNYSRRCAEASAVQAHMKQGLPLAPGMEIGFVIRDARKWEVDPERTASKFDAGYYIGLLEKAWSEAAFVFTQMMASPINPHSFRNCSICRKRIDLCHHHFCQ